MDFYNIKEISAKKGVWEITPDFVIGRTKDLMVRGGSFYAIWDEEKGLWSTDEYDVAKIVDKDLYRYKEERGSLLGGAVIVKTLTDFSTGSWDKYKSYISKAPDNYKSLDNKIIFNNTEVSKDDYISKKLSYDLENSEIPAYNELMNTLYDEEERAKIEWAIGSIISGDAKRIQKFIVLYGDAGSGKSTVLNIIQMLFEGYYTTFDAKELTQNATGFATDSFSGNPLVAIQHDGDLSNIKDNSLLNSIVSHEEILINEKFKARYSTRAQCFLFMATNKPVRITDGKSGIIRRLIDVTPSGRKVSTSRYNKLMNDISYELGGIAYHCLEVYKRMGRNYYGSYKPIEMMYKTDPFFNFVEANFDTFREQDGTSLKAAYAAYKKYCDDSEIEYKMQQYKFREELKNYFKNFEEQARVDGVHIRSYYSGFLAEKFMRPIKQEEPDTTVQDIMENKPWLEFNCKESLFDKRCNSCLAQYGSVKETPKSKWADVTTKLKDLDTSRLHYVRVPDNHIVIDFDLKDENGEKSFEKNYEAALKWPATYAELSKSGKGIHLHYIYKGDPTKLSRIFADDIEIKVFTGNSSLRRRLTKCNDINIAEISSGLPMKLKGGKMVEEKSISNEKHLRALLKKCLNKEVFPNTKPSIDFIFKLLEDAYESGMAYDVTDMRNAIIAFAGSSRHQADYCLKLVNKMHFHSEEPSKNTEDDEEKPIAFYDIEVFPNLFLVNWKIKGNKKVNRMINPTPAEIEHLITSTRLVGFNCRRYDNHLMWCRMMGYDNEQLYNQSQKIINKSQNAFMGEAYNLSYADVYDFCSKKQSLKKWEIELGIHHQELGLPWDQPVPKELWNKVAEYCDNDVIATEAVWDARQEDFIARQILADISGLTVNDTTRSHTTKIIFGNERHPELVYTDLSELFPGYEFKDGHSSYLGEDPSEGGRVYAEPGIYEDVALLDIASMHPTSAIELNIFGKYTKNFKDIKDARLAIKHKDFETAGKLLNGAFKPYLTDKSRAKDLAQALKIVINSVYGYTTATFDNPFKDPRNVDNIVAKRGSLFMINLQKEVQKMGYTVAHIKTDSIKIPNADEKIINFVMEYGKKYGYDFEHEATYEKMCLVNDAVYVAKDASDGHWTATGTQFQVPYVFKKLFSHEPIEFSDLCETKSVSTNLYLDMNERLPDVSQYEAIKQLREDREKGKQITKANLNILESTDYMDKQDLEELIEPGHSYKFVGKVGLFCPIKPGCGGGILLREQNGKYYAATGTKGYRWLESEDVKDQSIIDEGYYISLVDEAMETINEFGDAEAFIE